MYVWTESVFVKTRWLGPVSRYAFLLSHHRKRSSTQNLPSLTSSVSQASREALNSSKISIICVFAKIRSYTGNDGRILLLNERNCPCMSVWAVILWEQMVSQLKIGYNNENDKLGIDLNATKCISVLCSDAGLLQNNQFPLRKIDTNWYLRSTPWFTTELCWGGDCRASVGKFKGSGVSLCVLVVWTFASNNAMA